jgi:predicted small lipoprotein YifL
LPHFWGSIARRLSLAAALIAALALSACGRAGPLEPPPGPALQSSAPAASAAPAPPASQVAGGPDPAANQKAIKNGFDAQGNPVAPPGEKKPFPIDFLLQ